MRPGVAPQLARQPGKRTGIQAVGASDARELVVLAVAGAYLQTVATAARVDSQRAQVDNAQAVYHQARIRKEAGTNARIDVTRTLVELQTQQQRLNSLAVRFAQAEARLSARVIGLPLDRELTLTEPLAPDTIPHPRTGRRRAAGSRRTVRTCKPPEAQVHAAEHVVDRRPRRAPAFGFVQRRLWRAGTQPGADARRVYR